MVFGYPVEFSGARVENLQNVSLNGALADGQSLVYRAAEGSWRNENAVFADSDGDVLVAGTLEAFGALLYDTTTSNSVTLKASAGTLSNFELRLPADDGAPRQLLRTDGAGNLSWAGGNFVLVTSAADLPAAADGFHRLADGTTYLIDGAVTLSNGIEFGSGCALAGSGYASRLTFSPDTLIGFKSARQDVYISGLNVVSGGNNATGLFLLSDIDYTVDPATNPFMGRSKRVLVNGCNFFGVKRFGTIDGFGTININNNFLNGQQTVTEDGFKVSNGLSLEFVGNKVVLWKGTTAANSGTMLHFVANNTYVGAPAPPATYPGPGFNAVLITGNIFHPRSTETGVGFDDESTTALGTISGNTFISETSTTLIGYPDQAAFANYNPRSISNVLVSSNNGVPDSSPAVSCFALGAPAVSTAIGAIGVFAAVDPPTSAIQAFGSNARIGVRLLTDAPATAFVEDEVVTGASSGVRARVARVEGPAEYWLVDSTGAFSDTESLTGNKGGSASITAAAGTGLKFEFKYLAAAPVKMFFSVKAAFAGATSNNQELALAFEITRAGGAPFVSPDTGIGFAPRAANATSVATNQVAVANDGDAIRFLVANLTSTDAIAIYNISFQAL